ncbi:MAG: N-6 DNA methylase [Acidimicrobiia bacterium]|nr:N-6 DNA methylase [Acidimicrobiia bacterium]
MAIAGRPFTTEASRWSRGLLQAEQTVCEALVALGEVSTVLAEPGPCHNSALLLGSINRASRRLVTAWVCGVLLGYLDRGSSLLDAERWFTGSTATAAMMPVAELERAQALLAELVSREGVLEMLPYALDPIPHEYRRNIVQGTGNGTARATRKQRGSFYTPTDVAEHIVSTALSQARLGPHPRVLDPALGTGVFLRSTFKELLARDYTPDQAISCLHGVDIDECAVDMASFVLLVDYVLASRPPLGETVFDLWWRIRGQLLAANTLAVLDGLGGQGNLFSRGSVPVAWLAERFDVIVGNPPYSRLGEDADFTDLAFRFRTYESANCSTDIYLGFVELLCSQLRPEGAGALVVPMSIGYSTTEPVRRLREAAIQSSGHWTFEFFDRTPDALFGDDVKQRTAIVTWHATERRRLVTSPVMRWTSSNRHGLFDRIPRVEMGDHSFVDGVPKVGSNTQATVYRALRPSLRTLDSLLVDRRRVSAAEADGDECSLYVAGTAYNWLNVYRTPAAITASGGSPTASPLSELTLRTPEEADTVYAVLSSRLLFWLWRVERDAFHVPIGWLQDVPMLGELQYSPALPRLARIGQSLWDEVVKYPVISLNGGKTTLSYCPHASPDLLNLADRTLLEAFGLPISFADELREFVRELTTAGRSDNDYGLQRALASWRED